MIRPDTSRWGKWSTRHWCVDLQILIAAAESKKVHADAAAVDRSLTGEIPKQGSLLTWRHPLGEVLTGDSSKTCGSEQIVLWTAQQRVLQRLQRSGLLRRIADQGLMHRFDQGPSIGPGYP